MRRSYITAALLSSGLLMSGAAFAQTSTTNGQPAQKPAAAQKQKTQSDPTSQYNFATPGGQYSARPAVKQKTDGEDVTGNNNFAPASK
jgi:hypothetical protein